MTRRETEQHLRNEMIPVELGGVSYEFKYESRCRCCSAGPKILSHINTMLLSGATYTDIFREVSQLDTRKKPVTFNSIWKHGQNHVPSSSAAVRKIIEERAERMGRDFVSGTQNLLDEFVYAEVMMKRAFEKIATAEVEVSPKDGLEAAKFVRQIKTSEEDNQSIAGVMTQLSDIISAVKSTVPETMWREIAAKVDGTHQPAIMATASEVVADEDAYDPEDVEPDDELD